MTRRGPLGICALCQREEPLCNSHILPKFVGKWQMEAFDANRKLRRLGGPDVNRTVQGTAKARLLCRDCEGRFNKLETPLALHLEAVAGDLDSCPMNQPWMLPAVVSMAWRALVMHGGALHPLKASWGKAGDRMRVRWRSWLLKPAGSPPGRHYGCAIPTGLLDQGLDHPLNWYASGVSGYRVVPVGRRPMVLVKLPMMMFVSTLSDAHAAWLRSCELPRADSGHEPFMPLLDQLAHSAALDTLQLSPTQRGKSGRFDHERHPHFQEY